MYRIGATLGWMITLHNIRTFLVVHKGRLLLLLLLLADLLLMHLVSFSNLGDMLDMLAYLCVYRNVAAGILQRREPRTKCADDWAVNCKLSVKN